MGPGAWMGPYGTNRVPEPEVSLHGWGLAVADGAAMPLSRPAGERGRNALAQRGHIVSATQLKREM
ncbi:hypothetical protein ACIPSA_46750 [Streptomyces sp. NPDC086549]|uniref:hypothetical protein n=1 Tax=Streptomyces sp. NPDC086549 TaxID=3365752 RepID=UPI00382A310D